MWKCVWNTNNCGEKKKKKEKIYERYDVHIPNPQEKFQNPQEKISKDTCHYVVGKKKLFMIQYFVNNPINKMQKSGVRKTTFQFNTV